MKKNKRVDSDYKNPKHEFYFSQNPREYDDPRMMYSDLKNVLGSIDEIKGSEDKRGIRKALDLITDLTQKGVVGERVGRISDYGSIRADLYKISEYLSEAKYNNDKTTEDFFDLAVKYKKSLLDKVNFREKQLNGEIPRFDWMNPNNLESINRFLKVAGFFGFIGAFLFLFPKKIGGAVIADSVVKSHSFIGVSLLIIGLVSCFFLFKFNKK